MAIHKGVATFTLDTGRCPRWLFERMVRLGREMTRVIISEEGPDEFIKRISDPAWFQSLGTVLAFDWNASGLTTILTAALKEAIRGREQELGIFICGGKGKTSRKTPEEIERWSYRLSMPNERANALAYNSRMAAKVDSALIQDGFQIYHHSFFFSRTGAWAVVQQGMNKEEQTARRYHWYSRHIKDLIQEPHTGIASDTMAKNVLDLTSRESASNRTISAELIVSQGYHALMKDLELVRKYHTPVSKMAHLLTRKGARPSLESETLKLLYLEDAEFRHHPVERENFSKSKYLEKILWKLCDEKPDDYEKILATEGVGPKTIRALSLVSEVIYGAPPSYEDPARYSFAHGGKDATPYPVDRATYDQTIRIIKRYVEKIQAPFYEKKKIAERLDTIITLP